MTRRIKGRPRVLLVKISKLRRVVWATPRSLSSLKAVVGRAPPLSCWCLLLHRLPSCLRQIMWASMNRITHRHRFWILFLQTKGILWKFRTLQNSVLNFRNIFNLKEKCTQLLKESSLKRLMMRLTTESSKRSWARDLSSTCVTPLPRVAVSAELRKLHHRLQS